MTDKYSMSNFEDDLKKINQLVGLSDFKALVETVCNHWQVDQIRQSLNLAKASTYGTELNAVFSGNTGTGKSTSANLLSRVYKTSEFLTSGHVVHVTAQSLVDCFVIREMIPLPQAAVLGGEPISYQRPDKIKEAEGGVLFIHDAAALSYPDAPKNFSNPALCALKGAMDNPNLSVILTDQPAALDKLFEENTILKLFFSRERVHFPDYTPTELMQIFKKFAEDEDFNLSDEAQARLTTHFETIDANQTSDLQNATLVQNFFRATVANQSARIVRERLTDRTSIKLLTLDDLSL